MLVEIKARFDEQANIKWARKLEQAGCHVVYGLVGLKTHCKLSLVVRAGGATACAATPTSAPATTTPRRPGCTRTSGCSPPTQGRSPRTSPTCSTACPATRGARATGGCWSPPSRCATGWSSGSTRRSQHHRAGRPAYVRIKVNSMVDEAVIDALYRASQAGVPVDIWVRGICALRPGVAGLSENIRVRSVLGRFLEHSPGLRVRERRRARGVDRQRRHDAPQPGPPDRGAGPAEGAGPRHRARETCSTSASTRAPARGGCSPTTPGRPG